MPASECVACLYVTHLSEFFTYNSVVNYLSALWALHKILGYPYPDPSGFLISSTLRGAKFELGCSSNQAAPMTVDLMRRIFLLLNMSQVHDLVFWLMLIAGFRGLLWKSNLCEPGFRICVKDVEFCRGGAQALAKVGVPLAELKEIGDWKSWSVLLYLARPLDQRITLESRNAVLLFLN